MADNEVVNREIILQKYPFVITYRIGRKSIKVINIIHTSCNPIKRKKVLDF